MYEIKHRIKQLRTMLNLSMAEFASSINVSPGNVGDWESLKRPSVPSCAALISIVEKYDVSLDWLLFGQDRKNIKYSETIIADFTADKRLYEELVSLALKLDEDQLELLVNEARIINNSKKTMDTNIEIS